MTPVSWVGDVVDTLPKTHISPAKLPSQKGKDCLNPPFFSGVMIVLGEGYLSPRMQIVGCSKMQLEAGVVFYSSLYIEYVYRPPKTNMTMENPPYGGHFPMST